MNRSRLIHHKQNGMSLLEALIAVVVITTGLLSISLLQARSVQYSYSSFQRAVAVSQANDLVERLWRQSCVTTGRQTVFSTVRNEWVAEHSVSSANIMPSWSGTLTPLSGAIFRIDISWADGRMNDNASPSYTFQFQIPELECEP